LINRLIATSLLILSIQFSFGQKINWAKYDKLPFNEDTTSGLATRIWYNQRRFPLYNLTESPAIFELRIIPVTHRYPLAVTILQFYKDSTILKEYYEMPDIEVENFSKKYRDSSAEVYAKGMTPLLEKTGGHIWKMVSKVIFRKEAKKMIAELTNRNLFTIDINEEIANEENKINTDSNYSKIAQNNKIHKGRIGPLRAAIFEIKYKNKYKTFRTGTVLFYYFDKNNMWRDIEQFQIAADLTRYLIRIITSRPQHE